MNLDILETFITVVDRGSITAASRQLGMSQPAVSIQIATLEEVFDAKLLTRSSSGVDLTEAGKLALDYAYSIQGMFKQAVEDIGRSKGEIKGQIDIAASNIPGMFILPEILHAFREVYPLVNIDLEITNSRDAIDKILSGKVHVATIGEVLDITRLDSQVLVQDEVVLIAPQNFHVENIGSVLDLVIGQVPLIRRKDGSSTKHMIDNHFKAVNQDLNKLNVVGVFNNVIAQVNAVCEGIGVAFVSRHAIKKELALNQVKIIDLIGLPIKRGLNVYFREESLRNRVENAFYGFCHINLTKNI